MPNTVENMSSFMEMVALALSCSSILAPKERIVELDETKHEFGLEVVEGIMLKRGFSSFKTTFNLSSMGEKETLVDIKVVYETERDGEDEVEMKEAATKPALSFLQLLEKFLLHSSS
ncbi:Phytohormone-binding protein [Cucurbita argyrosperma subsp. argyrosperma]|nr:Phytohormone-binding protein [Cucurbita argyrosperma subsp. argyrosperma]